jgi:hypothetical protein
LVENELLAHLAPAALARDADKEKMPEQTQKKHILKYFNIENLDCFSSTKRTTHTGSQ